MTEVSSAALFAAFYAAFAMLNRMVWNSISQIRHKTANKNNGIPNAASMVTLPVISGADALSDFNRAISLYGCIFIAADIPFLRNKVYSGIFCLRDGRLRKKGHLHRR